MSDEASPVGVPNLPLGHALEQTRPEMQRLADKALLPINLDPLAAVCIVRGALPKLLALRPRIVAEAPAFELGNLDRLETYALALTEAHTEYLATSRPLRMIELSEEASVMRATLLTDVKTLIHHGRISASRLLGLKRRKGHCNVAMDVLVLATILRVCWADVENMSAVTAADLDRAMNLGNELVALIGMNQHTPEAIAQAARERQQAYTLMVRAYSDARKAIRFVCRPNEDFDKIAPSLYQKRHVKRRKDVTYVSASDTSLAVAAAVPLTAPNTETPETVPVRPGLPGADPFMN